MLLATCKTPLHVCSIEAIPGSQFIAGAYQLEEGDETPSRIGSLTLYDAGATWREVQARSCGGWLPGTDGVLIVR